MSPLARVRRFLRYLFGKRSELDDLAWKDAVMTKVILDIHRKRQSKGIVEVPLFALQRIHGLDRENARRDTQARAERLRAHKDALLRSGRLDGEALAAYLPSVSRIKVVQAASDRYLAFEGNGRIAAMQSVFEPGDGMKVEVEQYHFRRPKKILRRLDRVRRLNGLLEAD